MQACSLPLPRGRHTALVLVNQPWQPSHSLDIFLYPGTILEPESVCFAWFFIKVLLALRPQNYMCVYIIYIVNLKN